MMKVLSLLAKDKSALSNVIGYVLLISVTLSLSVLVYGWLRFYVSDSNIETCSEDVSVIIENYTCSGTSLTVTLKNKGLFEVDGYVLRFHNRTDAEFGFYPLDNEGVEILPGEKHSHKYDFSEDYYLNAVTLIEVQPFINGDNDKISCKAYASQKVEC